jgi:hypothetical protein
LGILFYNLPLKKEHPTIKARRSLFLGSILNVGVQQIELSKKV